jgi:hypothetical protein
MVDFEVDTLSTLISKYKCMTQSLNDILSERSDSDARLKAGSPFRMIQSFQFIVALVVTQHIVDEWEENIHFKVLHSHVINFSSSGPMSHSSCRSSFLDHYINRILSQFSDDFLASVINA